MKKKCLRLLVAIMATLMMTACGGEKEVEKKDVSTSVENTSSEKDEDTKSDDVKKSTNNTEEKEENQNIFDEHNKNVSTDLDSTIATIKEEYEKLVKDIDTYDKYLQNVDKIEAFYTRVCEDTNLLCIRMREHSVDYAEAILASDKSNGDKYDDFEELYDCIYEDAGDEILDEIYEDIFEDIYDIFYDGILKDAVDNGAPYDEWYDVCSDEYDRWYDARSDVYEKWYDFRSDVYDFCYDVRSELFGDDIEKAKEKIADFKEDIEKIKSGNSNGDDQESTEGNKDSASEDDEDKDNNTTEKAGEKTSEESPNTEPSEQPSEDQSSAQADDGSIDPEFKDTLDSYEAFIDEYIAFLQKYQQNPDDASLLIDYTDYMTKYTELTEKIENLDEDNLNEAEMQYYTEVITRVSQKLMEASAS